jgi:hypothetical protein
MLGTVSLVFSGCNKHALLHLLTASGNAAVLAAVRQGALKYIKMIAAMITITVDGNCYQGIISGITYSVVLVRRRTIPTERPPLVGIVSATFCG